MDASRAQGLCAREYENEAFARQSVIRDVVSTRARLLRCICLFLSIFMTVFQSVYASICLYLYCTLQRCSSQISSGHGGRRWIRMVCTTGRRGPRRTEVGHRSKIRVLRRRCASCRACPALESLARDMHPLLFCTMKKEYFGIEFLKIVIRLC